MGFPKPKDLSAQRKINLFINTKKGITAPTGFLAAGIHSGIKKAKKDLALIYSTTPASVAAVFTTNKVQAAPILVCKLQLNRSKTARAIVVNSGNANACTGERGLNDALAMVLAASHALNIAEQEVLVSSTGVIGQYLPIETIMTGISNASLALNAENHTAAAEAIMTTDKFSKEYSVSFLLNGKEASIGGMSKGSGMIAPNMATMLAFITTDVCIAPQFLQEILAEVSDQTFNRISVDGDTSTNDMVAILANGQTGNQELQSRNDFGFDVFYKALKHVLLELSKMIVLDGEGATKFVEIKVIGASSQQSAVQAGRCISNSNLVKTAIHGEDANWGRILAAIGYSGIDFNPAEVEIFFDNVPILRRNYVIDFSEADAKQVLIKNEITITVNLNIGTEEASFWTCDLSKEYVAINANYRS